MSYLALRLGRCFVVVSPVLLAGACRWVWMYGAALPSVLDPIRHIPNHSRTAAFSDL